MLCGCCSLLTSRHEAEGDWKAKPRRKKTAGLITQPLSHYEEKRENLLSRLPFKERKDKNSETYSSRRPSIFFFTS